METATEKVKQTIEGMGRGSVFAAKDFHRAGKPPTINKILSRLSEQQIILRLARGIYCYPEYSDFFEKYISADVNAIREALERIHNCIYQMTPASAANMLGLSTQVPVQVVYLTNKKTWSKRIGAYKITALHTEQEDLIETNNHSAVVLFQALNYFGEDQIDYRIRNRLSDILERNLITLSEDDYDKMKPWMKDIIASVAQLDRASAF